MHGTTPERVHFHEVGAVDAIVDVTGACIGLHLLGVDAVHVGALPVGGGFVDGPHGRIPVPGPGHRRAAQGLPDARHRHPPGAGHPDRRRDPHDAGGRGRERCRPCGSPRSATGPAPWSSRRPTCCGSSWARPAVSHAHRDHRPGRDHRGRHVAPALRAPAGAAPRGRRAGRLAHPGHHEAQPARGGPDRALRAGAGRRPLAAALRGILHHRRALDRVPAQPPRARDGAAGHRLRAGDLQGLPARGPGGHGHAGIRGSAPHRARPGPPGPGGARAGARRGPIGSSPPLDTVPGPAYGWGRFPGLGPLSLRRLRGEKDRVDDDQRCSPVPRSRAAAAARALHPGAGGPDRHARRMRHEPVRRLHGASSTAWR